MNSPGKQSEVSCGVIALLVVAAATACDGEYDCDRPRGRHAHPRYRLAARRPPGTVRLVVDKPFTGDLDEMVKRRAVRVAVTFNRTHDFIDKGQERGLTYEALKSAAYNAGPGRLRQLRRETETRGLDPNVWFNNVERVASERIGRETVTYVSNIYKYYITYKLVSDQGNRREAARAEIEKRSK